MEMSDNKNLEEFLESEKKYRESGNYIDCLDSCLRILNEIKSASNNYKFETISKLFLYPNQSNFVRIYLMHALFQDNNFISSNNLKRKYYQLLIDSFKHDDIKDLSKQKKDIIELFEKSELNNFEEIDKYIVTLVSSPSPNEDIKEKNETETEKNFISELKEPFKRHKSVCNSLLVSSLSSSAKRLEPQENSLPQSTIQTSYEDINTIRQSDLNYSMQKIINT